MTPPRPTSPEDELLAAELAFGLLDAPERAVAEARESDDAALAQLVRRWRDHLATLLGDESTIGQSPAPAVWAAIDAAIGGARGSNVVELRRSLRRWRTAAAGFGAIAAALLLVLLARPHPVPGAAPAAPQVIAPQVIVLLEGGTAPSLGAVTYDAATHRLTTRLAHLRTGGRVPQLWVIGRGAQPRSLGLVDISGPSSRIAASAETALLAAGATLAVSLEPTGGSPTGLPTGPVVLSGEIS